MNNSTHVTLVVDHSGSMSAVRLEAEQSINNFLTEQKAVEGDCSLSLYEFNSSTSRIYSGTLKGFERYSLVPSGLTALSDAVGIAIRETGEFLRNKPVAERPDHVVFVVMTDGEENCSQEFTVEAVAEMVAHQETKYDWKFVFLGAGLAVALQAAKLGFNSQNTITLHSNTGAAHTSAYAGISASLTATRGGRAVNYGALYDSDGNLVVSAGAQK